MSPSGAVVDCENLINVLDNLVRYEFKIKNAKDDWKRYIDALHNIIHVCLLLTTRITLRLTRLPRFKR